MPKYYDKKYFKEHDFLDELSAKTIQIMLKDYGLKKVLDVGCGTGRLVKFLNKRGFDAFGCDSEALGLKIARKINKKGKIFKASAEELPLENESFDLVSALSVIEHLSEKGGINFIKEARRVLKKQGLFFIITPNYNSFLRFILRGKWFGYSDPTHIYFYSPKSLEGLLKKLGFINIQTQFKPAYNLKYHWYLPKFLRSLPMPIKNLLTYLIISSPLSTIRDSFWMVAQKK